MGAHSYFKIKRLMDVFFALLFFIPALLIVGLCYVGIRLGSKGPGFFTQQRPGYGGKLFTIYKLRTMVMQSVNQSNSLSDEQRMTKLGRAIRALSLDELPQILNIIKGDMSFVGPRPLLEEYLPLYTKEQMRRHDVLPGISDWAQVNGRNGLSWQEKIQKDVWYVENMSFALDMRIFAMTIKRVLRCQGINPVQKEKIKAYQGSLNG